MLARMYLAQEADGMGKPAAAQAIQNAKEASDISHKLFQSLEDADGLAAALQIISRCHLIDGDGEHALQTARETLELHDENSRGSAVVLLDMAAAYNQLGNHEAAQAAVKKAESIAVAIEDED